MGLNPHVDLDHPFRKGDFEIEPFAHDPVFDSPPPENDPSMACGNNDVTTPDKDDDDEKNRDDSDGSGAWSFEFKNFQGAFRNGFPPVIEFFLNSYIFGLIAPTSGKTTRHIHVPISPPLFGWLSP